MTALEDAPDEIDLPPLGSVARERFTLENDRMAAWAARKLRDVRRHRAEVEAIATVERERIERWVAKECRDGDRDDAYFEALLIDYAYRQRAENPRRKRITTPYGTVQTRSAGDALVIEDADQLLAWARCHHPELVRTVEDVPLAAIREALPVVNGEVPPGMSIRPGGITATVDIDLGGN